MTAKRKKKNTAPALAALTAVVGDGARYPCGLMQGDDKAKATVDAMMSGLLKDVSKYSLEKGVASSVLANRRDLVRQVGERCTCSPTHWCQSSERVGIMRNYQKPSIHRKNSIAAHVHCSSSSSISHATSTKFCGPLVHH